MKLIRIIAVLMILAMSSYGWGEESYYVGDRYPGGINWPCDDKSTSISNIEKENDDFIITYRCNYPVYNYDSETHQHIKELEFCEWKEFIDNQGNDKSPFKIIRGCQ